mmetsp:Transcript_2865/g.7112  ORF Transcript_2865/g.7112 Transcript_2865/m.7112 type:complete len:84 (-) Transcript_2865:554-805(-)
MHGLNPAARDNTHRPPPCPTAAQRTYTGDSVQMSCSSATCSTHTAHNHSCATSIVAPPTSLVTPNCKALYLLGWHCIITTFTL